MVTRENIENLKVGYYVSTAWGKGKRVPAIFARRLAENEYKIEYVAPLPEKYGEDPASVRCGCPMQGQSHGHAERICTTVDEAWEVFEKTENEIDSNQSPTFSEFIRVGQ